MNATLNEDKFKGGIREAVLEAFAEKEEATRLAKVEELLKEAEATIAELSDNVTNKETELSTLSEDRESLKAKIEELESQLKDFNTKLDESDNRGAELEKRAEAAEKELASLAAEARLSDRMKELEDSKVVLSGEARKAQAERICGLSDDEFAVYKAERVELRNQLEAEFSAAKVAAGSAASEANGKSGEVAPANIEAARKEEAAKAAAATLNVEVASENVKNEYNKMAEAMAERLRKGRE